MKNLLDLVTLALLPTEQLLRNEYLKQLLARHDKLAAELKEDGMDAKKRFDYPEGTMPRLRYVAQKARYDWITEWTTAVKASRSHYEPNLRVFKDGHVEKLEAQAAKMAKQALEGFCHKMAGKIDKAYMGGFIDDVRYSGGANPWVHSFITCSVGGKIVQQWKTKMIVNISCLGKLFNQWPTTLLK